MDGKLETIATFNDLTQAQAARAALEAEGIACDLLDETTGSIDWGLMPALGGLRLQVKTADVPQALDVLSELGLDPKSPDLPRDDSSDPSDAEERTYRESSRRRKRLVGWVSFLIFFLPVLFAILFGILSAE